MASTEQTSELINLYYMFKTDKLRLRKGKLWVLSFSLLAMSYSPVYAHLSGSGEDFPHDLTIQQTVQGTVVNRSTGQAISGVTISVKGTAVSTQSDRSGKYDRRRRKFGCKIP